MIVGSVEVIVKAIDQASPVFARLAQQVNNLNNSLNRPGGRGGMNNFANSMMRAEFAAVGLGSTLVGTAFTIHKFIDAIIEAELSLTKIMLKFQVAADGDLPRAGQMFEFAAEQSRRLGLSLESTASGYAQFSAAIRGTTLEGKLGEKVFVAVTEAAAALGLSTYEVERAFKALEQMVSKGTVQMEELRGQLSEQIPGSFQTAAKAMGLTTTELSKLMKEGKVVATELIPKLAEEWHKAFGPVAEQNADRLTGAVARMQSAWFEFKTEVTNSDQVIGVLSGIAAIIQAMADGVKSANEETDEFIKRLEKKHGIKFTAAEKGDLASAHNAQRDLQDLFGIPVGVDRVPGIVADALEERAEAVAKLELKYSLLANALRVTREEAKKLIDTGIFDIDPSGKMTRSKEAEAAAGGGHGGGVLAARMKDIEAREAAKAKADEDAKEAAKKYAKELEAVMDKLSPLHKATGEYQKQLSMLTAEFNKAGGDPKSSAAGKFALAISTAELEFAKASGTLRDGFADLDNGMHQLANTGAVTFVPMVNHFTKAIDGMDDATRAAGVTLDQWTAELQREVDTAYAYADAAAAGTSALREFHIVQEVNRRVNAALNEGLDMSVEKFQAFVAFTYAAVATMYDLGTAADVAQEKLQILSDGLNDVINAFLDAGVEVFKEFITTGNVTWKEIGESLLDTMIDVFADILRRWLILQAQMAAGDYLAGKNQTSGGGGMWSSILRQFSGGKTSGGGGNMGMFGGGGIAGTGVYMGGGGYLTAGYGAGGMGPPTSAMSGSATGALGAAALVGAFVVIVAALAKKAADSYNKTLFQTGAGVSVDPATGAMVGGWGGKLDQTGPYAAARMMDLFKTVVEATGSGVKSMEAAIVRIRNDKKSFEAEVGGTVIGRFATLDEAIIAATKKAFETAEFSGAIDESVRRMVTSFVGTSVDAMQEALSIARGITETFSGMSAVESAINQIIPSIHALEQQLLDLGVSATSAAELSAKAAANSFLAQYRDIWGVQESPKEALDRRKQEGALLKAQIELYKVELQARMHKLRTDIEIARAELEARQAEAQGRIAAFGVNKKLMEAEGKLVKAGLDLDRVALQAQVKLWEAELAALEEVFKVLNELDLDIGKIKLPKLGKNLDKVGKAMDSLRDALLDLARLQRDMLTGPNSPFTTADQTKILGGELFGLFGKDKLKAADVRRIIELIPQYLEAFGETFGTGGAGYFGEFAKIQELIDTLLRSHGIEPLVDWQKQLEELFGVSMFPTGPTGSAQSPYTVVAPKLERHASDTADNTHATRREVQDQGEAVVAAIDRLANRLLSGGGGGGGTQGVLYENRIPGAA